MSPRRTGTMKSSRSMEAVNTAPAAWRIAATPAQTSIHCIMTPPNITPATPLVCIGITICVITQRVCSGLTPASLLLLGRWGRLLGRLGSLDLALDPRLQLRLALAPLHLGRPAIV